MHIARIMAKDGHKQKDIAEKLGVCDRMVRKYLKEDFGTRLRKSKRSVLEPFHLFINDLLEDDPYINLVPVYERLQRRGYTGEMTILRDYVRKVRKRITTKAVLRYETEPGLQAQVDWKECGRWNIGGELIKLYAFVMVLGYSRKPFVLFTTNMKISTVLKAHLLAFAWYEAVPREILYDNMKTAWLYVSGRWTVHPKLLRLASACGFTPRRCRIRRPQTKGKVERFIGYLGHNFLPRVAGSEPTTIDDLNEAVTAWLGEVDERQIGGLRTTRRERFAEEKPSMLPWVSEAAPDVRHAEDLVVSREGMITWQTNRYSVPADFIGETVTLKINTVSSEADIVHEGTVIRSMTIHPSRSHCMDRREEDTRSLRQRWERESTPKTTSVSELASDTETELLNRLFATRVEIRHPAAYDEIVEHSA
ncbi:MAG: IS21 family transposase [Spirochaetaceae bacterium]|nr:MAG: IS21 family transposase [Spirochaetaceae bacterium]